MKVQVWHKGWYQSALFADAVNDEKHELHEEAIPVFHRSFRGYEAGDQMFLAFEYVVPDGDDHRAVLNEAFELFNVGTNQIAREYRAKHNRSLSVGDVVVIDDVAYSCDSLGWSQLDDFVPVLSAH